MGKISPVSAKYIINASINIDGVVDRPDVIGAIFGQTEGLLGSELELRELQRSGRIGRIEVVVNARGGKTSGHIIIPSSLDKAETAIIAAAFEIIERIGPCNATIKVNKIEDVRISKRQFVVKRAKELLRNMIDSFMPDSQELAEEVACSVRVMEITEFGKDRLPAGPLINDSDEIIVVEGRADVITLLKQGIKNAIAMNGASCPQTIIELSKIKEITVFVDGDRGGLLNIKELLQVASIDFVTRAPDGKEVEELAKKEIHQALRNKVTAEQIKREFEQMDRGGQDRGRGPKKSGVRRQIPMPHNSGAFPQRTSAQRASTQRGSSRTDRREPHAAPAPIPQRGLTDPQKAGLKKMVDDLIGTRGAFVLDANLSLLGKVPVSELPTTLASLGSGIFAIVFDGSIDKALVETAEKSNVQYLVGMDMVGQQKSSRVQLLTGDSL